MIQCPECRNMIPDDSAFCDQCGKELKWCPVCKRPKRGTECPVCASDLIPGRKYLAGGAAVERNPAAVQSTDQSKPVPETPVGPKTQSTAVQASAGPTRLVGNGWSLPLQPGGFGRWPAASMCPVAMGKSAAARMAGSLSTSALPTALS